MRKMSNKNFRKNVIKNVKGITLIALVITIVVLLIITGIVINFSLGDNAVLNRATEASKKTKRAQVNDYLTMKKAEIEMDQFDGDSEKIIEDIASVALDKRVVGLNNIKIHESLNAMSLEEIFNNSTVEATIKNGDAYFTTELKLGIIKAAEESDNNSLDIGIGELKSVSDVSDADKVFLAALKSDFEDEDSDQYTMATLQSYSERSSFIPPMLICDNANNKYYENQTKMSFSESDNTADIVISFKEVTLSPMKLKVNSGEDCTVNFDMECARGTIDWGDGTQESIDRLRQTLRRSSLESVKLASLEPVTKLAVERPLEDTGIVTHTYADKNKEYDVTFNGICLALNYDIEPIQPEDSEESVQGVTDNSDETTEGGIKIEDFEKVTSIEDFGSIGAVALNFTNCDKLTKVVSPNEYTFMFTSSMYGTFANCTSLEEIPDDLFTNSYATTYVATFMNCNKLKSIPAELFKTDCFIIAYDGCFYNCRGLTGNAPELWKNVITVKRQTNNTLRNGPVEADKEIPSGACCFYNCLDLSNYDAIPDSWKLLRK